jgi:hypothetical protein
MSYYTYIHIRLDKNEVFYVGIGKKSKQDIKNNHYSRAYNKAKRSNLWKKILNKTDYKVKIIFESENREDVINKEIELIKFYGRKDLHTGILTNLTDGGEGMLCRKIEKLCEKTLLLDDNSNIIKEFESAKDCHDYLNIGNYKHLRNVCINKKIYFKGKYICYKKDYIYIKNMKYKKSYVVGLYENGNLLKIYNTAKDVIYDGYCEKNVGSCLRGERNTHKGFEFKKIYN